MNVFAIAIEYREMKRTSAWAWLLLLMALAIAARAHYGLDQLVSFDGCGYIMHAQSLASGKISAPYWAKGIDHWFPPLYPLIILVLKTVAGDWTLAAKLSSWIFSALFLIPVYLIAAKLRNRESGVFAAALTVSYPLLVDNSANAASEPPFLFFLGMAAYFLLLAIEKPDLLKSFLSGLMFGLSYLTRYQGYSSFFSAIFIFLFLALAFKKISLRIGLRSAAMAMLGFFILAAPYDAYCFRAHKVWMLRPRQEFFKKDAQFRKGFDWYRNERYLDAEAKELVNLKRGREQSPVNYIFSNFYPYLKSSAQSLREFFRWGVGQQAVIPVLILLLCLAFLAGLFMAPGKKERNIENLFLALWMLAAMFIVILLSSDIDRYYLPMLIALLVWAGQGVDCLKSLAARLPGRLKVLASNRMIALWVLPLLILFPRQRLQRAYDQKDKADKVRYAHELADWSKGKLPGSKKIVMSTDPVFALLTGNYWYMMPVDYPERMITYAREQGADYLMVEDSIFWWLGMPPDWFGHFKLSEDIRGLSFVGAYGDTGGGKIRDAILYKIAPEKKEKPPNIILAVVDGLRPEHLGCYGHAQSTSPSLDALAAKGARFRKAVSQSPRAFGSLMSVFTSLFPEVHGTSSDAKGSSEKLSQKITTLPEVLKGRGYRTAGFFDRGNFNQSAGFERGMDVWEQTPGASGPAPFAKASEWAGTDRDKPFFLLLHARPRDYLFSPPGDAGLYFLFQKELLAAGYDAEIKKIDRSLGEFFEDMKNKGILDNTLVIITGNRGAECWERGGFSQPGLYAENVFVPLIFCWPGRVPAGKFINAQVRLIDLMPTIIDLAGAVMPGQTQGASLRPFLFGKADLDLFAASEEMLESNRWYALEYGMRDGKWFYYYRRDPKNLSAGYDEEFYDESNDPLEQKNLLKEKITDQKLIKETDGNKQVLKNQLWMHYLQNQRMSRLLWEKPAPAGPGKKN